MRPFALFSCSALLSLARMIRGPSRAVTHANKPARIKPRQRRHSLRCQASPRPCTNLDSGRRRRLPRLIGGLSISAPSHRFSAVCQGVLKKKRGFGLGTHDVSRARRVPHHSKTIPAPGSAVCRPVTTIWVRIKGGLTEFRDIRGVEGTNSVRLIQSAVERRLTRSLG